MLYKLPLSDYLVAGFSILIFFISLNHPPPPTWWVSVAYSKIVPTSRYAALSIAFEFSIMHACWPGRKYAFSKMEVTSQGLESEWSVWNTSGVVRRLTNKYGGCELWGLTLFWLRNTLYWAASVGNRMTGRILSNPDLIHTQTQIYDKYPTTFMWTNLHYILLAHVIIILKLLSKFQDFICLLLAATRMCTCPPHRHIYTYARTLSFYYMDLGWIQEVRLDNGAPKHKKAVFMSVEDSLTILN